MHRKEYKKYKDKLKDYDNLINKKNTFTIDDIYNKKEELEERFSIYRNIKVEGKAIYNLSFMKSEDIINIERIIGELDRKELILKISEGKTTYKLQGSGEVFIRCENGKYIVEDVQACDVRINNMIEEIGTKDEMYHIVDKQIREKFIKSFEDAKDSLCIASPWLNNYVINEELIRKMENVLKRGANIKIRYGIEDNSYNSQVNSRSLNTDRIACELINRFKMYGKKFKMQKVNSHYKLIICDESYYIEGSFNFLSFAGEYDDKTKDHRGEGATYCTNNIIMKYLRKEYFNF